MTAESRIRVTSPRRNAASMVSRLPGLAAGVWPHHQRLVRGLRGRRLEEVIRVDAHLRHDDVEAPQRVVRLSTVALVVVLAHLRHVGQPAESRQRAHGLAACPSRRRQPVCGAEAARPGCHKSRSPALEEAARQRKGASAGGSGKAARPSLLRRAWGRCRPGARHGNHRHVRRSPSYAADDHWESDLSATLLAKFEPKLLRGHRAL